MNCIIKKNLVLLCLVLLFGCTKNNESVQVLNGDIFIDFKLDLLSENSRSKIFFKEKIFDFRKIKKKNGSKLLIHFPYVNVGNADLVIYDADVSCQCMKVDYPINPIHKGEIGVVKVLINITNQQGVFNKNVFIKSNATNDIEIIRLKGIIE